MSRKAGKRALLLVILAILWWLAWSLLLPAGDERKVTVRIPLGFSAGRVGQTLAEHGVIHSAFGFRILARLTGKGTSLKPGAYELSPAMAPLAVLDKIARGDVSARWVTFPEGFTLSQMGERLAAAGCGRADRFMRLTRSFGSSFRAGFSHPANLEGYLFPDTYLLPLGASEEDVIKETLDCFERRVIGPLGAEISRSGMTLHEVITLASMIEREAKIPKDRLLISAVLRNRLRKGMLLECDATVLYALGRHKNRVFYRDLDVDSPYNTYIYPGLPPGPIANPGLESIKAALRPAKVDYLYYVAAGDGSHIFSKSLEQHHQAVNAARRRLRR